jgi:hypothetical protein
MRNILFWFMATVSFFSTERMKAMQQVAVPISAIYEASLNASFPDCQLQLFYRGMENRKTFWEREEYWPLLCCIDDGRVLTILAFLEDGCPLTTENIAKVIIEYFRRGRYSSEGTGRPELLFEKLSRSEQIRATKIMKAFFFYQLSLIEILRMKQSENPSTQWLLETIIDAE